MRKIVFGCTVLAGALALAGSVPTPAGAQDQQALVIEGGTLIDGNGGAPVPNAVVVVQGNQIAAVGRAGQVQVPAGAKVIDAKGKYVLPGLWDSQVNYAWFWGELFLNQGETSTIDIGDGEELSVAERDAILHGKFRGPRLHIGIGHMGGVRPNATTTGYETALSMRQVPKTPQEARTIATRLVNAGADVVEFHDGHFDPAIVKAGCDVAHAAGKPCSLRASGPRMFPADAAAAGVDFIPHAVGVGESITKDPGKWRNELDRYSDMDDAKARALIKVLVAHHVALVPTIVHDSPSYPKGWAYSFAQVRKVFSNPDLQAYYDPAYYKEMMSVFAHTDPPAVHARREKGYQNMLRWNKMFDAAGGHVLVGGDTNAGKAPGLIAHSEAEALQEAGIPRMHIIEGMTKWPAETLRIGDKIGTIDPGKLADITIVDANPLDDIRNLRKVDTVIFNGKVADIGFHADYNTPFLGTNADIRVVEDLPWVADLKKATFHGGNARGGPLPNPFASPQPAIERITPVEVTAGDPTTTLTITGFNFVRRSRVFFDGKPVTFRHVSPTELAVTLDSNLLRRAGRFDIVVKNPAPMRDPRWGDGTSNTAHLIVNFKY